MIAKAKAAAYKDPYENINPAEGRKPIYKLSKQRNRRTRYLTGIAYDNDRNGTALTDEANIKIFEDNYFENIEIEGEELEHTFPVTLSVSPGNARR